MTGIQVIAIAAALVMAYTTYTSHRRHELRTAEFLVWLCIWGGLALVSLFPDRLRAVIAPLAVARLLDLVVIGGILFLGIAVFQLNRSLRRLDHRLEEMVQGMALASARERGRGGARPSASEPAVVAVDQPQDGAPEDPRAG